MMKSLAIQLTVLSCLGLSFLGCAVGMEDKTLGQSDQEISFNVVPPKLNVVPPKLTLDIRQACGRLVMKSLPDGQAQLRMNDGSLQNVWVIKWYPSYGALNSGENVGDFVKATGKYDERTRSIYRATIAKTSGCK